MKQSWLNRLGILVIVLYSLYYGFSYLLQSSVSVFIPDIIHEYNVSDFQIGIIGTVFFLSYVFFQVPYGMAIDKYGVRYTFSFMVVLCAFACFLGYIAKDYFSFLLSRFFIGAGTSAIFICALITINDFAHKKYVAFLLGLLSALSAVGSVLGQTIISFLNSMMNWHKVLMILSLIGLLFLIINWFLDSKKLREKSVEEYENVNTSKISYWDVFKDKQILKIAFLGFVAWSPVASLAGFWLIEYFRDIYSYSSIFASNIMISF